MQIMMENAQRMAEAAMGVSSSGFKAPASIRKADFPAINVQSDQTVDQEESRTVKTEQLPEETIETTSTPDFLDPDFLKTDNAQKDTIEASMLKVVSELTGYPVEMLDMGMDIEADLGIDSIKRVEILSAFEEEMPGLASISPDLIGEMNTLGQITDYLVGINKSAAPTQLPESDDERPQENSSTKIAEALLGVVSELTGYPVDMLDMNMDIEADLGIDSIKRVEILSAFEEKMPGLSSISPNIIAEMNSLGQIFNYLTGTMKDDAAASKPLTPDDRKPYDTIQEDIEKNLLKVVSDLTGYPVDMLDMDMDIEADLGIDSIKRVEILSAFEEKMPDLPTLSPDVLGEIKTLGEIYTYLTDTIQADTIKPDTIKKEKSSTTQDISTVKTSADKDSLTDKERVDDIVERNIVKMVEKPFTLNKEVSISNDRTVLIFGDNTGLGKAVSQELKSRKISSKFITPRAKDSTLKGAGGLIILPQTDSATQNKTFNETDELFLKNAFLLTSRTAPALMESGKSKGAIFATVTCLDGCFGFKGEGVSNPLHGGLAGLSKTAAIEWNDVCCHAIDIAPYPNNNKAVAKAVVSEILNHDPEGQVEVGLDINKTSQLRFVPELQSVPFPKGKPKEKIDINDKDVVVVTGGARGVTAACVLALAKECRPTVVLLGRSPAP
jgi:acyl carrier protein